MATATQNYGTYTAMTVTNLHSLATDTADPFAGWQSDKVDNVASVKAQDYEILVEIAAVNTAPAGNKAVYVYAIPWTYDGSAWHPADNGTATAPTGSEGTMNISEPNNMRLLGVLSYTTQNSKLAGVFNLSNAFGSSMPDGFSIAIRNETGMTFAASANIVAYRAIKTDIA